MLKSALFPLFFTTVCFRQILGSKDLNIYDSQADDHNQHVVIHSNTHPGMQRNRSDHRGTIQRPCPTLDMRCIREYFAHNSHCKPSDRPVPDPYYHERINYVFPAFDAIGTQYGVYLGGLNARVEVFYVNTTSDVLVLQIGFRNLVLNSTLDIYRWYRVGQEPVETTSRNFAECPSMTITTLIHNRNNLNLIESEHFLTINECSTFYLDPSGGMHPDPAVARMFAAMQNDPNLYEMQAKLYLAPVMANAFIQYRICDFGI